MASDSPPEDPAVAASKTISSDPLSNQFGTLNDLCYELSSLQDLAFRGSWRTILDKVSRARKLSLLQRPHEHLCYFSYNVLALAKLRRYGEVSEELASLEDLDNSIYQYESHPDVYPNRSGSMVPFALRWIHAEIPLKLGKRQETLDRLYALMEFVRARVGEKRSSGLRISENVWKRREAFVLNSIIGHHLSRKEFVVCLSLIRRLMDDGRCDDPVLVSKLGCIQLQIGDLEGVKASFELVERLGKEEKLGSLTEIEFKNLVNRNKALVYLAGKDYVSAVREYDECIERDDSDVVAINNKALCLMYLRDLADSIKVLENALERVPTVALNETLVVNLCSMYELAYVNNTEIKMTLSSWIAQVAPDDFDSSCTRV